METDKKIVMVIDDEPGHRQMVRAVLEDAGWKVVEAPSGEDALELIGQAAPHVALVDMRMPGMDGLTTMRELHARLPDLPVVLLTAYGNVGRAVEAMKHGAYDYLTKPTDNDELKAVLDKCYEYQRLLSENARLRQQNGESERRLIGNTPGMDQVRELIEQAGPSEATVLITGESGTGKELVAEGLHQASNRAPRPLIKVNCAALPADLLESELFGYVKGAFTGAVKDKPGRFQLANKGTLFLDEIGEMDGTLQAKLLRALQERTIEPLGGVSEVHVDVRILAATNRDLKAEVEAGNFREDLYYRLAVLEVNIPPLRDRLADLPLLVSFLLGKLGRKNHKEIRTVTPAFLDGLAGYHWPGNVRELENVLERALILTRQDELGPELLPPQIIEAAPPTAPEPPDASFVLENAERQALIDTLEKFGGHREKTANAMKISRRTLQYKLKKFGLTKR